LTASATNNSGNKLRLDWRAFLGAKLKTKHLISIVLSKEAKKMNGGKNDGHPN
jgi:hypothetical protein